MQIRDEVECDRKAVHAVNEAAFGTPYEADLVDALRQQAKPIISLVAEDNSEIIGHIMFSPVSLSNYPSLKMMGLAPMAVTPEHQRKGTGSALVQAGLDQCRELGVAAVVVLGHPDYYSRFGFTPSSGFDIDSDYEVPQNFFMAIELQPQGLRGKSGRVRYHPAFQSD